MNVLIIVGVASLLMLLFVSLAGIVRGLERAFPELTEWLDRHVGEEPKWMQPW